MEEKLTKDDFLTIPNFMSAFRILLIPAFTILYCRFHHHFAAAGVVVLSAVTDFADGRIARKFNMVTRVGKILDPLADKLTQAAMMLCLVSKYPWMYALLALLVIKEVFQLTVGCLAVSRTGDICGAHWYGKVSTGIVYAVMLLLFVFPKMLGTMAYILMALCGVVLLGAMGLYGRFFLQALNGAS